MQSINLNGGFIDWFHGAVKKQPKEKIAKAAKDAIPTNIPAPSIAEPIQTHFPTIPEIPPQIEVQFPQVHPEVPETLLPVVDVTTDLLSEVPTPLSDRNITILDSTSALVPVTLSQRILAKMTLGNIAYVLLIAAAVACVSYVIYKWTRSEKPIEKANPSEEVENTDLSPSIPDVPLTIEKVQDDNSLSDNTSKLMASVAAAAVSFFVAGFFVRKSGTASQAQSGSSDRIASSQSASPSPENPNVKRQRKIQLAQVQRSQEKVAVHSTTVAPQLNQSLQKDKGLLEQEFHDDLTQLKGSPEGSLSRLNREYAFQNTSPVPRNQSPGSKSPSTIPSPREGSLHNRKSQEVTFNGYQRELGTASSHVESAIKRISQAMERDIESNRKRNTPAVSPSGNSPKDTRNSEEGDLLHLSPGLFSGRSLIQIEMGSNQKPGSGDATSSSASRNKDSKPLNEELQKSIDVVESAVRSVIPQSRQASAEGKSVQRSMGSNQSNRSERLALGNVGGFASFQPFGSIVQENLSKESSPEAKSTFSPKSGPPATVLSGNRGGSRSPSARVPHMERGLEISSRQPSSNETSTERVLREARELAALTRRSSTPPEY